MRTLVYDCIRDPYDIANILQMVFAVGGIELYFTGNALRHDHPKVVRKVSAWSKEVRENGLPEVAIHYFSTLQECIAIFKKEGKRVIGTSPMGARSYYDVDTRNDDFVLVFGTEVGGLSAEKREMMDEVVFFPMRHTIDFMTLPVITALVIGDIQGQRR